MRTDPILIAAFEGWNDAGAAASALVETLIESWNATPVGRLDEQEYYDFQVTRPHVERGEMGERVIVWPGTQLWRATTPQGRTAILVRGLEPSFHWQDYVSELLFQATEAEIREFVVLGALLADVPHTRPFPTSVSSSNATVRRDKDLLISQYEGPMGIAGLLEMAAAEQDFETLSIWVSVPHYVADPPAPKASLALARELQLVLGEDIDMAELRDEATEWENNVSQLAEDNPDVAGYVSQLEKARDTVDSPLASGDAIAAEIEKYLRRRGDES